MSNDTFTVMTWNLWWQFGPWQERAPAIAATLAREAPDIICLQEVWDDGTRNFAAELAEGLGYSHAYAPGAKPNGIHMGNAVLSRWPIAGNEIAKLYGEKGAEEFRVAIRADISGPNGTIPVISTHLNYLPYHSHIRQKQVADILGFIKRGKTEHNPPILCGDFNAEPASDEIRMITGLRASPVEGLAMLDAWHMCHPTDPGFTWSNDNPFAAECREPDRRIDLIFAGYPKPDGTGQILDCRITGNTPINGIHPSDHYGVIATLRL